MKTAITILFTLTATAAHATYCANGAKDYPKCTPIPAPTQSTSTPTQLSLSATSASNAGASSSAEAAAQGIGQGIGYGGDATAGGGQAAGGASSLIDSSTSNFRALSLSLAPLGFTPPMAPVQCPTPTITQTGSGGRGWGFWSTIPEAKTDTSDCALIHLRNAKVATCQYASAKQVEDLLIAKHLPGFQPSDGREFYDYSPKECALLLAPPPIPQPISIVPPNIEPPKAQKPKPPKRKPVDPCAQQCKRPGSLS